RDRHDQGVCGHAAAAASLHRLRAVVAGRSRRRGAAGVLVLLRRVADVRRRRPVRARRGRQARRSGDRARADRDHVSRRGLPRAPPRERRAPDRPGGGVAVNAAHDPVVYRARAGSASGAADADPITTELVRNGLNSAANQMKRVLIRTAFSPVIYEVLDFAVALYDREVRLLAQAPSLPTFMGTMSFCVEAAVEAVGGEEALDPGDIILYNVPYGTGSHPQDAAVVMPVFLRDE